MENTAVAELRCHPNEIPSWGPPCPNLFSPPSWNYSFLARNGTSQRNRAAKSRGLGVRFNFSRMRTPTFRQLFETLGARGVAHPFR